MIKTQKSKLPSSLKPRRVNKGQNYNSKLKNMNKALISIIVTSLLVGGGAFYGGIKYEQGKNSLGQFSPQNFQDLSSEQRQQLFQGNMGEGVQRRMGGRDGSDFLGGEVIAKDEESLTIKMFDGGSKIIFFSDSTEISKTTNGSIDDVGVGKQIMVDAEQNSDGSYTAKTIQLSSSLFERQ
jgi:hypothetical protein